MVDDSLLAILATYRYHVVCGGAAAARHPHPPGHLKSGRWLAAGQNIGARRSKNPATRHFSGAGSLSSLGFALFRKFSILRELPKTELLIEKSHIHHS
jgi:hypothetical protein